MSKINVVINYIHYPVSLARYFHESLLVRDDVNVLSCGPYTGSSIPWNGGMQLPLSYLCAPNIPIPPSFIGNVRTPPQMILSKLREKNFIPDLWINVDAGYNVTRPQGDFQVVNVFTDAHVLNYDFQRTQADINFNMHKAFSQAGDRILPYAASEIFHYPEEQEKIYDVCLIGLHYPQRDQLVNSLRGMGLSVYYDLGPAYHDYRKLYAQSKVAISWSSRGDLIARVFETLAMKIPLVTDRVPDLPNHFVEDEHYKGFSSLAEAVQKVWWCLRNYDEAMEMAENGHRKVYAQHLYKFRVSDILRECKLI
jgi:hypothetical protein